jgi:uncharacterized protein (DUF433 family)
MEYRKYIHSDPNIMLGKPLIKDTRISVELILKKLSEEATIPELLESYPNIKKEDIMACISYSADVIEKEEIIAN